MAQLDELIYQPLVQSLVQNTPKETKEFTWIQQPTQEQNDSYPVEPVQEWPQPLKFDWNVEVPDNYVEKIEETPKQNYGTGKVYKTSEKEEFKTDLYNAYHKALKNRGFDEKSASDYAKKIVAQDALESGYGTSSLSKIYNFGGIKDFRQNSDSLTVDTKEHINGKTQTVKQPFRKFRDLDEYVNYKIDLLGNSNFDVFSYGADQLYRRLVSAKKKYATDPKYEGKLNSIYNLLWRR